MSIDLAGHYRKTKTLKALQANGVLDFTGLL